MKPVAALIGLGLALSVLTGCAGSGRRAAVGTRPPGQPTTRKSSTSSCSPGAVERLGDGAIAYAALVRRRATVFREPGLRPVSTFGRLNVNGAETVFAVLGRKLGPDCRAAWYRVELPTRPNGASGWVVARRLRVGVVHTRIIVDLSERRLVLFRDGRRLLETTVGVGSPSTPTPTGRFYVDQRLIPASPAGPWGPGAIGVSAHSDVLRGWAQGGPIAIHGTNEPWSIGRAASHGCIRVANGVLRRLFWETPAGTPVIISA